MFIYFYFFVLNISSSLCVSPIPLTVRGKGENNGNERKRERKKKKREKERLSSCPPSPTLFPHTSIISPASGYTRNLLPWRLCDWAREVEAIIPPSCYVPHATHTGLTHFYNARTLGHLSLSFSPSLSLSPKGLHIPHPSPLTLWTSHSLNVSLKTTQIIIVVRSTHKVV